MFLYDNACFFTGHRFLRKKDIPIITELLLLEILRKYRYDGVKNFICGGAKGFDLLAGFTTIKAKYYYDDINLILFLPCENQDKNWHINDKALLHSLKKLADNTLYISKEYDVNCMQKRNHAMVDNSSFGIAFYDERASGTKNTIDYAMDKNIEISNIAYDIRNNYNL